VNIDYIEIDGALICEIPSKDYLDWDLIQTIATHTQNTWQPDRDLKEIMRDTAKGKTAELVLEYYLKYKTDVRYLSYDNFRRDGYKKHAPFDGLIFNSSIDIELLNSCINTINDNICYNEAGQIEEKTRQMLENNKIFTLEIKSSQMRAKDYEGVKCIRGNRSNDDYITIVNNIRKWDFFTYPYYLRKSDSLSTFYEYAEYVRNLHRYEGSNQSFLSQLMTKEFNNASDINTRMYFDYENNQIIIPGYILKDKFYKNPKINKMPGSKSGKALYYMRSISEGASFVDIDQDKKIWESDILQTYNRLFAIYRRTCPKCGESLQICNAKKSKVYKYKCFQCEKWYTMDEINEVEIDG